VQEECRIAHGTATKAVGVIREVTTSDVATVLCGVCEADETYVGGSWKNKAVHIRRQGTKRGRGTSKQPVFGIIQRNGAEPSKVCVWLTPDTKNKNLMPHILKTVERESTIYTDGRKGYKQLPRYGYHHDWVDHDAGEYVRGDVHTQNIDGYWGQLKTSLDSIGGIRKERLHLFIGEHVWRFNNRHLTRKEQTKKLYKLLTRFGGR
jgi:transposase-like protein